MLNQHLQNNQKSQKKEDVSAGKLAVAGGILAIIWVWFKKLIPIIIGLIVWGITKNVIYGIAVCLFLGIWAWETKGRLKVMLIFFVFLLLIAGYIFGKPALIYAVSTTLQEIKPDFSAIQKGAYCTICPHLSPIGLMNPAECEKKCKPGVVETEPLLRIYASKMPSYVSENIPFSIEITAEVLAKDKTVKNLAIDVWIENESEEIPDEMYICPTRTLECLKLVEMSEKCGNDNPKCECPQNNPCELKDKKEMTIWFYNQTCQKKKNTYLYPFMRNEYEFTASTWYKVIVAKTEAAPPTQKTEKVVGPIGIALTTNKNVYILEEMVEEERFGTLSMIIANTGNGYGYVKNITIEQQYEKGLKPFEIVNCPGFEIESKGDNVVELLSEKKKKRVGPGHEIDISCDINIPSEGVTDFNEYIFLASVTYEYREEKQLQPIFLDCKED